MVHWENPKAMGNKLKIFGIIIGLILLAVFIKFIFFSPREIMFQDAILYGKIKSIKEISYKAELKNNVPSKIKRWRIGHLTDDFHVFFNEEGLPTKKIIYPAADTGTVSRTLLYKYNKQGKLINYYHEHDNPTKPEYFYNKKGQLIKEISDSHIILYEYNENGDLHRKTQRAKKIGREFQYTFTYENGFIKYHDFYYFGAKWHLIEEYKRDKHGNIIMYRMAGSFDELKKDKWDEFEYEFDKMSNWIRCIHYRYKKPIYIIEREIEYF
jgi:hypothetical protein